MRLPPTILPAFLRENFTDAGEAADITFLAYFFASERRCINDKYKWKKDCFFRFCQFVFMPAKTGKNEQESTTADSGLVDLTELPDSLKE